VLIHTADATDDWTSDIALQKANPNLGVSVMADTLKHDREVAIANPAKTNIG
jgi:hypothetical protein